MVGPWINRDLGSRTPQAIRRALGRKVQHRHNRYLNNRLEQDHRGIKQRYYPMRGFDTFASAARFCTAHGELRDYLRHRTTMGETVPLGQQRRLFRARWTALLTELAA
jgi:transposase-like protein